MLRSGATLVALGVMVLGPIYAGADYRVAPDPISTELQMAAIDRVPRRTVPTRPRSATAYAPKRIVRRVDVARGDTLGSLLSEAGLDAGAVARWSAAAAEVLDPRRFRVGREVTIEHDASGSLVALRYEIDDASTLVVERTGDRLAARRDTKPLIVEVRGVAGTVEHGLWRDVVAAGVQPAVASSLTQILGGEIDFRRIAAGDEFRVLYEVATQPERGVEIPQDVVGVQLRVGGRVVTAIRFEDRDGRGAYYAPDGKALGRMMLRYPLEYSRISSGFTYRRFHPILRRNRPHLGVDFAAPRGTPVRATADGTVMVAGWKRGMGRMLRVRHARDLETVYGHLSGIASGVRSGRRVRQGQVIGYVGSTGLATGNHLHYGVRRGGRFVNPLELGSVRVAALGAPDLPAFTAVRNVVADQLARLDSISASVVVSLAPSIGSEG